VLAEEKVLDVLAYKLQKKLEASNSKRLLHTVPGVGYVLREQKWGGADLQIPGRWSVDTGEPAPKKCEITSAYTTYFLVKNRPINPAVPDNLPQNSGLIPTDFHLVLQAYLLCAK